MTDQDLHTPILIWTHGEMPWRDDADAFYVLAANGLYMCRNHPFFRSCTKARGFPGELEEVTPFLHQSFPKIPKELMQQTVGFFSAVAEEHGSEAGLFLAWNRETEAVELVVAPQTATVSTAWNGGVHAVGLQYDVPTDLAPELLIFGDIHSHVDGAAYASGTDVHDEMDKPGLHVVVGRIGQEPPDVHAEIVVDGTRFSVDPLDVIAGYERRTEEVPAAWIAQVGVEDVSKTWSDGWPWSGGSSYGAGSYGGSSYGAGSSGGSSSGAGSYGAGSKGRNRTSGGAYGSPSSSGPRNGRGAPGGEGHRQGGGLGRRGDDGGGDDEDSP
jgi:proteasome lid subunit RPN8/RPN11